MSSIRTPAIVAGALFASLIGTASAHAATARIAPVTHTASAFESTITLVAHHRDACRMLVDASVVNNRTLEPVWRTPRRAMTACQRVFEDGSALGYVTVRIPPPLVRAGVHYWLAVRLWSHERGASAPWVSHTFLRYFDRGADPEVF